MSGLLMSGRWTMSMACMPMGPGTWARAAASFLAMWIAMMAAMMLPSLVPMLWRYRESVAATGEARLGPLTARVGAGYFFVWTIVGLGAFPLDAARTAIEMEHPALGGALPFAVGAIVLLAGAVQFTAWKAHRLGCCRDAARRGPASPSAVAAWRHGLRLGLHCVRCCANLTTILLVVGIMDVRAIAIGGGIVVAGVLLIARAAGLARS
jgi:predicted metal-binding membrane protein